MSRLPASRSCAWIVTPIFVYKQEQDAVFLHLSLGNATAREKERSQGSAYSPDLYVILSDASWGRGARSYKIGRLSRSGTSLRPTQVLRH